MDKDAQLKLQAYLDGELPEAEAREIAEGLAQGGEAVALQTELRQTCEALAGFEEGIRLPESREFYWSKIRREIERQQPAAAAPKPEVSLWTRLRYILVPAAGLALVAFVAYLGFPARTTSPSVETALADSRAFTYRDDAAGTTLVWLSYPAEKEPAAVQ